MAATNDLVNPPVLLVHGYGGQPAMWLPLMRQLRAAGHDSIELFRYLPLGEDVPALAARLVREAEALLERTGAPRLHLVGHSAGGLVIRYAAQVLGFAPLVASVTTLASPHLGTGLARFGRGALAADMRPGSPVLTRLADSPLSPIVRWTSLFGLSDRVVDPRSARLPGKLPLVRNVAVERHGHLSILVSSDAAREVLQAVGPIPQAAVPEQRQAEPAPVRELAAA